MAHIDVPLVRSRFGQTSRADNWWVQPLLVFLGFSSFILYSTWAAFQGQHFRFGPYLSPFYSPELLGDPLHSWFGAKPQWMPAWVTAAMLILWAPGGFRFTCYYYRGAYYKAFWADPPSCTVGEPRKTYLGERSFPLIVQNIHRYFLYLALVFRDRLAGAPVQKRAYDCVSCLNRRHQNWAWCSLFSVGFSDLYVRMCSMGVWTDWRIL